MRKLGESKPPSLKLITRGRAVHSAYFSLSGNLLATRRYITTPFLKVFIGLAVM